MCHAVVAVLIASAVWPFISLDAGLAAGTAFYAGREYTQWEQGDGPGLPFDWKGIVSPLIVCLSILIISHLLR
ncbi:hypothetical protein UFOVP149_33 [uncultured Caudovirales phage]|uniref:Uncharacterized protein n=1 Tax=uncultured Caudovirales phage TaxID=2100421 RepID=A0A6J7WA30_9CAUD|nr:hypothetical protein UFOVP149_33 [uncultured Caudovirales phage]